jgi:hypothetical protein
VNIDDVYTSFVLSISQTESLQLKVNSSSIFNDDELNFLYESAFLRIYRAFENFLESAFLGYMTGATTAAGNQLPVHCHPRDLAHARSMLIAQSPFLDWTKVTVIKGRCETWFHTEADRFKTGIVANMHVLGHAKDLRNHISHNSEESQIGYLKLANDLHLVVPEEGLQPGALLRASPSKGPARNSTVLQYFITGLRESAAYIAEAS